MKVLVACEESQEVCKAFRMRGHEAYSCDIVKPSGGHPEWHILGNAIPILTGGQVTTMNGAIHDVGRWDLLVAHPPCTYLSNAGAGFLWKGKELQADRVMKGIQGRDLFMRFWWADIPKICIENPVPSKVFCLPAYTQIIQPYEYGHPYTKRTCLWLKGLPPLFPTDIVVPENPGLWRDHIDTTKTERRTVLKHSPELAGQWPNNGADKFKVKK